MKYKECHQKIRTSLKEILQNIFGANLPDKEIDKLANELLEKVSVKYHLHPQTSLRKQIRGFIFDRIS